jgi:uncharacterized protein (DUF1501 family)
MTQPTWERRQFLDSSWKGATGIAIGCGLPGHWMQVLADEAKASGPQTDKILVVIQLSGGNDGLNTIVPFRNDDYRKARPKLGIPEDDVIKLDDELGLHPSLRGVSELVDAGRFSIVHGVGYPSPNRSHFESMDIWHTCQRKETRTDTGWLGRVFERNPNISGDSAGLHLGGEALPFALVGRGVQLPSIREVEQMKFKASKQAVMATATPVAAASSSDSELLGFLSASTEVAVCASQRIESALARPDHDSDFPKTQLGEKLKVISRLILAGLRTQVYYVTLDGFDTHANQLAAHQGLLRQWSDALSSFHKRLTRDGQSERVLVMTFSEFGRRLKANASQGTDHGAAAPMFFSGPTLSKLQIGSLPSLTNLDDGDLKHHTDFRQVYATVIEKWLKQESERPLGGKYALLEGLL